MIVDFAIHDPHPPGHNPHAHVLLTMRAIDEHGKWLPKSRKVYDLDESGERIKLPSGRWKSHKEDTVDWNDQKYCEIWRHEWEVIQNRYLEANDRPERVDLRSYARSFRQPPLYPGHGVPGASRGSHFGGRSCFQSLYRADVDKNYGDLPKRQVQAGFQPHHAAVSQRTPAVFYAGGHQSRNDTGVS